VLITPATPSAAPGLETTGDPKFNSPWSFSGLPTISLPCALSGEGLPLSIQLIGAFGKDEDLLIDAGWTEAQIPFEHKLPRDGHESRPT
jgi:aspartyl-tRNA(Asn)/glutamyl-tRNA(Gln) amidotransferase subunit A